MEIDAELKNLIDEYIKEIENKEGDLVSFKKMVDGVISDSKKSLDQTKENLEKRFEANEITEEEYLSLFRESKKSVLEEAKIKFSTLLSDLSSGGLVLDKEGKERMLREKEDASKLDEIRKSLGV